MRRWLLVRRSTDDPEDRGFYQAYGPEGTPIEELVRVCQDRWAVEQCFAEAKGEVGLDHYEVRNWDAWHRHVTLALFAHALLAAIRAHEETTFRREGAAERSSTPRAVLELVPLTVPEVRRLLWGLVLARMVPPERALGWSRWRRCHQARAKRCHYRRRSTLHRERSRG